MGKSLFFISLITILWGSQAFAEDIRDRMAVEMRAAEDKTPPPPEIIDQQQPEKNDFLIAKKASSKLETQIKKVDENITKENAELKAERKKTGRQVHELAELQKQLKTHKKVLKKVSKSVAGQKLENHKLSLKIAKIKAQLAKYSAEQNRLSAAHNHGRKIASSR